MKKQLMVGLLSAGLLAAMLPGLTVAKDKEDPKTDCKKDGWTAWVREDQTEFADQDECVAYVARGGTLAEPTPPVSNPFQIKCGELAGAYAAPFWPIKADGNPTAYYYVEGCSWSEMPDEATFDHYRLEAIGPLCPEGNAGMAGLEGTTTGWGVSWVACGGSLFPD
jgi:hypothetical protein